MHVSMPYLGLTSFLPYRRSNIIISRRMCQCPISGSRHFYVLNKFQSGKVKVCVNALSRAHVISTASLRIQNDKEHACVNALSRAHVISTPIHVTLSKRKRRKVSMPYLGLTSFLPTKKMSSRERIRKRVNALSRAHVISTGI